MCISVICIGLIYSTIIAIVNILPNYQQQLATEFTNLIKQPVDFKQIKFKWRGLKVYAKVYNVDIGNHDSAIHIDNIRNVQFIIHPVKSLINLKPIIDKITVNGGKIYLRSDNVNTNLVPNLNSNKQRDLLEDISGSLSSGLKSKYAKWLRVNKVNLKNTELILINTTTDHDSSSDQDKHEFLISELTIYSDSNHNYIHGLIFKINKMNIANKPRELIEVALKLHSLADDNATNLKNNKFYIATNSSGLVSVLNKYFTLTDYGIKNIDLHHNTWLKLWGTLDYSNLKKIGLNKNIKIALSSPDITLTNSRNSKIKIENIDTLFDYKFKDNISETYTISFEKFKAKFAGSNFNISGNIDKNNIYNPAKINALVEFGHSDLNTFFKLLPADILGYDLADWLNKHVTSGSLGDASLLVRGDLNNDFPYDLSYDKPTGISLLSAKIKNATIDYLPGAWPKIKNLTADLTIRGRDLNIITDTATIVDTEVNNLHAYINDLGVDNNKQIVIEGNLKTRGSNLADALEYSGLQDAVGNLNPFLSIGDELELDLNLLIPFAEEQPNKVKGELRFNDNNITLKSVPITYTNLNGKLSFTDSSIYSDHVVAKLGNKEIKFNIRTVNDNTTKFSVSGWLDTDSIDESSILKKYLNGSNTYDADLVIYKTSSDNKELYLKVTSDLKGLGINFLEPFKKSKQDVLPVIYSIEHDFDSFTKHSLYLKNNSTKAKESHSVKNLIELNQFDDNNQLVINTEFIQGRVMYKDYSQLIDVNLDKLRLSIDDGSGELFNDIGYFSLPAIRLNIDKLYYGNNLLENIHLETETNSEQNTFTINHLKVNNQAFSMNVEGNYKQSFINSAIKNEANIKGNYRIKNLAKVAELIDADFKDKLRLSGSFSLTWPGELLNPNISDIDGDIYIRSGQGLISSIEPGLGRIFSFFNLDVLNKRLKLDFSDVFDRGYIFDSIRGQLSLKDGILTTKRTILQAGSADIDIYGNIDMNNKLYDLNADVMPHVTTSLPVAAAVLGTPVAGAAVFIIDKLLDTPVAQLTESAYHISGPWNNPDVKRQSKKRGPLIEVSWLNPYSEDEQNNKQVASSVQ